jgi:hypothetical protein
MQSDTNREDAEAMTPQAVAQAVGRELLHQAEVRPYTTVLFAMAAGYALGVATPTWATKLAWTVGSRMAVNRLVSTLANA